MHIGKTVFTQVMEWVHPEQFRRCVARYQGNYKVSTFSCWEQFLALGFAQMTFRESLADIQVRLRSRGPPLYPLRFQSSIALRPLVGANATPHSRISAARP